MEHPSPRIQVLADDRERNSLTLAALQAMEEVDVHVERLKVGDYRVDGCLVVERKGLGDLLNSIEDGRLFRQASALASCGDRCMLLLEGRAEEIQARAMRREAIQGALICVSLVWGVPVIRALGGEESARLMLYAARQLRQTRRPIAYRPGACPTVRRRAQTYIIQGLPGVGRELALRLLERFGSVEAVMTAPAEALQQLPGIGPRKAARIRWILGTDKAPSPTGGEGAFHSL